MATSDELAETTNSSLKKKWRLFDGDTSLKVLIFSGFTFLLFLFLHFQEVRVETLELYSVAPRYVVAQVDFTFLDEEAAALLREDAVRDLGKIYQLDEHAVRQVRIEFEKYLRENQEWRDKLPKASLEQLYTGAELVERSLQQLRFTDFRTLKKMESVGLSTAGYLIFTPPHSDQQTLLPAPVWAYLGQNAFAEQATPQATARFIVDFFRDKEWKLTEDPNPSRVLRNRVIAKVPAKYTKVAAGNRMIDQGEKVTSRHLAMLQAMKNAMADMRNLWSPVTLVGSLLLALVLASIGAAYLRVVEPSVFASNRQLLLLVTVVLLTLGLSKAIEFFVLNSTGGFREVIKYPLIVPFATVLLCSLMNFQVATFAAAFLTIVLSIELPFDRQGFMITNIAAAAVALLTGRSLKKRKDIFVVCAKAWLACIVVIFAIHFSNNSYSDLSLATDLLSTGLFMLITAVLVVGLLPLLESGFNVLTNVTLMEYMDPSHPLLRRLAIEAPGTYQHSLVVGNLAESAASAINANGIFCRVAVLYHDIGKMATPQYFTENQQGGMNIHQLLTPVESAQVIMAHVTEGVSIASKAGLPERFIDIIKEHHGTTLVYFFYRKQLDQVGNEPSQVDEKMFRYQGPRPHTKESAIIMISDSLEAASRSLEAIDETSLNELLNRLIREKAEDGQFDDCQLTFQEMAIIKRTLVKTILAAGHSRIRYPQRKSFEETVANTG